MTLSIILGCITGIVIAEYIRTLKRKNKTIDKFNKIIMKQIDTISELEKKKGILDNKVAKLRDVFPFPYHKDVDKEYREIDGMHLAEITHSPEFCITAMTRLCKYKSLVFYNHNRRTGNTTRLADLAIQDIFNGKKWIAKDHHNNTESNENLFTKVMIRLSHEHCNGIPTNMKIFFKYDTKNLTIELIKKDKFTGKEIK